MKKMICLALSICIALMICTPASGRIITREDNASIPIIVVDEHYENIVFAFAYGSKIKDNEDYPMPIIYYNGAQLKGKYTYPNYDSSKLGLFDLQWVFTPDDKTIEPISGTVKAIVIMPTWGTIRDDDDDTTAPVFKASSITMQVGTSYYPQIDNNVAGSDYAWKTSDKSIASINKKTGKLTAKAPGTVTITCNISTPYDEEYTLSTKVKVVANKKVANIFLAPEDTYKLVTSNESSEYSATYTSNKSSIARVNYYTGEITARKEGETYITRTVIDTDYNVVVERYNITVTE